MSFKKELEVIGIGDRGALTSKIKDFNAKLEDAIERVRKENQDVSAEVEIKVMVIAKKAMGSNASKLIRFAKTIDKIEKNPDLTIRLFEANPESAKTLSEDSKNIGESVKKLEKIVTRRNRLLSDLFNKSNNRKSGND